MGLEPRGWAPAAMSVQIDVFGTSALRAGRCFCPGHPVEDLQNTW